MSDPVTPVPIDVLSPDQAVSLKRDGYLLLRGAVPTDWREPLRQAFDAGTEAEWAAPRGLGWRHALVDLDCVVQQACRWPPLLAAVGTLLRTPFFLAQVEGREPLLDGGHQLLHRDGVGMNCAAALIFLDPYGPDNGATRVVSRAVDFGEPDEVLAETLAETLAGAAGDILVFDADILHGATCNRSGARRRSLLLSFMPETARAADEASRAVRNVRMDASEVFRP